MGELSSRRIHSACRGLYVFLLLAELHEQRACVICACGAQVKAGHQVAYLKALLQEEDSLPSQSVKLIYQGRSMMDPLSLADYPGLTAGAAKHIIEVKVRQLFAMTTLAITHIHVSRCSARFFPSLRASGSTMRDNARASIPLLDQFTPLL